MEKETPYEKKLRELKDAYDKGVAEAKKEYQEDIESAMKETPTEEWENQLELAIAQSAPFSLTNQWSDADFTPIKNLFHNLLSSHNAELARKIEGMKWETNHIPFATDEQIRECTCSACKHNQALDAVLALLTNKNV